MRFPSLLALTLALYLPTVFSAPQHDHGSGTDPGDDDHHGTPEPLEGSGQVGAPLPAGFLTEGPIDINSPPPTPGAKHVKKRYGPYSMKAGATLNRMITPEAPCTNCFITKMTSSLEYEDGSEANINTGSWLHHMVVYQRAGRGASAKIDPVCPSRILPRRRIFAVGNERTNKRFK